MIYLIGGHPRSGKTTLAKRLARRLGIGWVSVDILESIVREYTPAAAYNKRFPKNVLRHKTHGSNDEMYTKFPIHKIARAYLKQGKTSWKAIEAFVGDCIHEAHPFILEGHQIHPKLAAKLIKKHPDSIRCLFLMKKDKTSIESGFLKNRAAYDWVLQRTKDPRTYQKIAEMLLVFGQKIEQEAKKEDLPIFYTDRSFLLALNRAEKALLSSANP